MKQAFLLLGIMTVIVYAGAYIAFSRKAEAPVLQDTNSSIAMSLSLTSPAFEEGGLIPSRYTCDGENISPGLTIENVPTGTKSLVLVMDDPDIPDTVKQARGIEKFDHWAVYNIPADTSEIAEGATVGELGLNSRGDLSYVGSCPPDREHRYFFRLYALSGMLTFAEAPSLDELELAAQGILLEKATLMGRYKRVKLP